MLLPNDYVQGKPKWSSDLTVAQAKGRGKPCPYEFINGIMNLDSSLSPPR
jgi:hypothetical protein